ncbi:hypothetical protein ILUMI_07684 [Ignelater luminosus]|uniref:Uncharacterized protein n=1 Tax=Ignelater luminosus TaxID=2038154 RepID=A0A8K0D8B9_IGNLU|nr:hypothetical protein ILUMI_07684 [Ignelater luminosus]
MVKIPKEPQQLGMGKDKKWPEASRDDFTTCTPNTSQAYFFICINCRDACENMPQEKAVFTDDENEMEELYENATKNPDSSDVDETDVN